MGGYLSQIQLGYNQANRAGGVYGHDLLFWLLGELPGAALALSHAPLSRLTDHIPRPVNPFLDRETELATLLAMLNQPAIRLISVIGPGGMGKTRLVLAAAALA